ncbi:sigma 54-interacting transcriptional regulator [Desulfobacterium sp. N47]|uniref:Sigma-54 factor interaction domain-containing protein n=1 Tax=uncultured Desulfobacterium sp. TaxID=201089 RepID=E1YIX7_9BACT|nr:hypothetical protein N47_K27610 [uncultured Desulfobacterium sp.]
MNEKRPDLSVDENSVFREMTMRICGNLDINAALKSCMEYLEHLMPIDGMSLHLFDKGFLYVQTIAQVINNHSSSSVKIGLFGNKEYLSEEVRKCTHKSWNEMQMKAVDIFNANSYSDFLTSRMLQAISIPDGCAIVMRLKIEGNRIGVLAIYSYMKSQYTKKHASYLSLLHEPFAIAMSNAIKHKEVVKLNDSLSDDIQYLSKEIMLISGTEIIGAESGLKEVMMMVRRIAPIDSSVLLLGETGVGKEVIANTLHKMSLRKDGPFIKINCGSIPETLVDSELFGHEKGAFTGAVSQKRGRFERAHKGTLLLDEIGELPLSIQVRLLRILQNKEFERVGGSEPISANVRIICATNSPLQDMVDAGKFRGDLFFRINVFPIMIPPLRQRKEDIPALVDYFIKRKSKELKFKAVNPFTTGEIDRLIAYHWPGNVRELENVVERALILNTITNKRDTLTQPCYDAFLWQPRVVQKTSDGRVEAVKLDELIALHIQRTLYCTNGRIGGAGGTAELLGVNPSTLRTRMKKFGIERIQKK